MGRSVRFVVGVALGTVLLLLADLCPRDHGELELLARELARLGRGMRVAYWRP